MKRQNSQSPLVFLIAGTALLVAELVLVAVGTYGREAPNYTLIEDRLYRGGHVAKPPPKVRAVLNLCESPDPYRVEFHRWEPIRDAAPAPDLDWLRRMVDFVDEQQRAARPTYVHCLAGASRGPMVVVAYLMAKNHWTRDEALAYVRSKRPIARPNPAFMQLLAEWEKQVNGG